VATLGGLLHGQVDPEEAIASGLVQLRGDSNGLQRFVALFALPPREAKRASSTRVSSPAQGGARDANAQQSGIRQRQGSRTR
jgi:hypothetical protein